MRTEFSAETKDYLSRFYEILDEMAEKMNCEEGTDSISHNFIVQIVPYHKAAIEMSRNLLQYTTFLPLQRMATNIIEEQTKSVENMQAVLELCGRHSNTEQELSLYARRLGQITRTMFAEMENARATNDLNANFMREMIPHHRGAIHMSENALHYHVCPELVPILQTLIASQQERVCRMERLLRCF